VTMRRTVTMRGYGVHEIDARVLILAGRGRYEDPWHDHAATSHRAALVLRDLGLDVEVRSVFVDAFEDLAEFDLVVVNSGRGRNDPEFDGDDARWAENHKAVRAFAAAGGPVLGLHQAANTFADSPHWEGILGGRWIPGRSMHPPCGEAVFDVVAAQGNLAAHAITDGLGPLEAFDERYSYLHVLPSARTLVTQRHDGIDHPVVWVHVAGPFRAVYDALGHGTQAYASAARRRLLARESLWLLGADDDVVRSI
jgi:uncharacterized protein